MNIIGPFVGHRVIRISASGPNELSARKVEGRGVFIVELPGRVLLLPYVNCLFFISCRMISRRSTRCEMTCHKDNFYNQQWIY